MNYDSSSQLTQAYLDDIKQTLKHREQKAANKRRYTRLDHHSGTMVEFRVCNSTGKCLKTNAFIADESFGGLGLLAITSDGLFVNQLCQILMPGIGWIESRIAWLSSLDDSIQEMGIRYSHV